MLGFIFRLIDDDSHLQKQFKILFWYFEVLKRRQNPSFFFSIFSLICFLTTYFYTASYF